MKKLLLIIPALLFSILSFSQGIVFEHGTWKEVLAKAQKTNKPIFVDVFTTWCGPCKQMSTNIFPLETVGKVYNENFICCQIDAEKGEGIEIAKKYGVKAYPTYLFIKGDGNLFYLTVGSMPEKNFIAVSKTALEALNDPKPLSVWDKEYIEKKNDPAFLLDYMKKRTKLGLSNELLFDEYLKLIPEEERASTTVFEYYRNEGRNMKVTSFAYQNLLKNYQKFFMGLFGNVFTILMDGVTNTVREAAATKNEHLLAKAISTYDQLPKSIYPEKDEVYMQYYKATGEADKYLKYALSFANNHLMKMKIDSLTKLDDRNYKMMEGKIKSGVFGKMLDSVQLAGVLSASVNMERMKVGEGLNTISWYIFEKVTDKNILQEALGFSKRSLEFMPDNATLLDTYANLYYKLGQKQEAIANEKEALSLADKKDVESYKGMEETLRRMNAGEKTWK
jgi:thiol-disulfide isomerase/thioredoxin